MPAELDIADSPDGSTLVLTGELDTHTAPQLVERLDLVVDGAALVIDVSATTFISSAGLTAILNAQRRLGRTGGSVTLRSPSPAVARLIQLSGLSELLGVD
jgi:anti-sigma B factor antagonist